MALSIQTINRVGRDATTVWKEVSAPAGGFVPQVIPTIQPQESVKQLPFALQEATGTQA